MKARRCILQSFVVLSFAVVAAGSLAQEKQEKKPFQPVVGQSGKDVVWVPTPFVLIEKMLDLARVTSQDYVMDLGSGDGRNIIGAAKRGARGKGIEWNHNMVDLAKRRAQEAGVADKAEFVQGDMYVADISQANVMAMFLLTENLDKLMPKFLDLKPGSRIVINGFGITGWSPDVTERASGDCGSWCTAHLFYVPAKVVGTWQMPGGKLTIKQAFQKISGTLANGANSTPVEGSLKGEEIAFTAGGATYTGRVNGNSMSGDVKGGVGGKWSATKK
ncbi:MAG: methyltransferase domain-containing protein [Rhizobiales bacterium]|nr:methyltransferase domain-containing protein [Hyphomicrobiales bacterium]